MPAPWRASTCRPIRSSPRSRPGWRSGRSVSKYSRPWWHLAKTVTLSTPASLNVPANAVGIEIDAHVWDIGAGVKIEVDHPPGERARENYQPAPSTAPSPTSAASQLTTAPMTLGPLWWNMSA